MGVVVEVCDAVLVELEFPAVTVVTGEALPVVLAAAVEVVAVVVLFAVLELLDAVDPLASVVPWVPLALLVEPAAGAVPAVLVVLLELAAWVVTCSSLHAARVAMATHMQQMVKVERILHP